MAAPPINPPPPRTPDSLFDLSINKTVSNLWRPSLFTRVCPYFERRFSNLPLLTPTARRAMSSELKGRAVQLKNNTVRVIRATKNAILNELAIAHVDSVTLSVVLTAIYIGSISITKKIAPNYYTTIFLYYPNRIKYASILANLSLPIIKSITPYNSANYSQKLRFSIGLSLLSIGTIVGINSKNTFLEILTKNYLANFLSHSCLGLSHLTSRFVRSDRRPSIKKALIMGLNLISSSYLCSAAINCALSSIKFRKQF